MNLCRSRPAKGQGRRFSLAVVRTPARVGALCRRRLICQVHSIPLDNGETLKRGCGRIGLIPSDVGWRCFYCGNYVYRADPPVEALWFHFRVAREYWRAMSRGDQHFVNGVPVSGLADSLPSCLRADLGEPSPPVWFRYFLIFDEQQFTHYLESRHENP